MKTKHIQVSNMISF